MIRRSFDDPGKMLGARRLAVLSCGGAVVATFLAGCPGVDNGPMPGGTVAAPAENGFETAIELMEHEDFDPNVARSEAVNRLNRWIENEEPDPGWIADPLVGRLPPRLRNTRLFSDLDVMQYTGNDGRFLQHVAWMRDLARWIGEAKLDPLSERRLEETISQASDSLSGRSLGTEDAEQLALALALFDWTVRNIQLEPFPGAANPGAGATGTSPTTGAGFDDAEGNFPGRGIAGPGYTQFPGLVVQFGHGDAWQRAAVFLLLCHQAGIDAAMLAIEPANPTETATGSTALPARPWLPATLIGGQLYLFEPGLGLAIPGKDGRGVATLSQTIADPSLLRSLDYSNTPLAENDQGVAIEPTAVEPTAEEGEKFIYPVAADDLKRVTALLYVPQEYLTQRMRLLELQLIGDKKMALTMTPSSLAEKLRAAEGVKDANLWSLPYDTLMYRIALDQQGMTNPAAMAPKFAEEQLFNQRHNLAIGRRLHLRGQFSGRRGAAAGGVDVGGAKGQYLQARMTDRELEMALQTPEFLTRLNLKRAEGEDKASHQTRLDNFAKKMRVTRRYANYWMGLAHYDNRNFDTAAMWLQTQVLGESDDMQWRQGAQYNIGRARESMGQTEQAIAAYQASQSPQRHGDLLRAKWLAAEAK